MATIGLKDIYMADVTEAADGTPTYGTPEVLSKSLSVDLAIETTTASLYASDALDETEVAFVGGTLTINIKDLTSEQSGKLLGQTVDADGVAFANSNDQSPYKAIGFRAPKSKGVSKFVWFHRVKFAPPNESFKTKGSSTEYTTPTLVGNITTRKDGNWKADISAENDSAVAQGWFTTVREPKSTPTPPTE